MRREPLHPNNSSRMMSFIFKLIQKPEHLNISLLHSSQIIPGLVLRALKNF